jgi:hypothetical protein
LRSAIVGDRAPLGGRVGGDAIAVATDTRALVEALAVEAEATADATVSRALRDELVRSRARWPVDTGRSRAELGVTDGTFRTRTPWLARARAPYSAFVPQAFDRFELPMRRAAEAGLQAVADALRGDR